MGPRPHLQHGDEPARLVHLAPARLGRADPGGRLHGVRRGDADAGARRARGGGLRAVQRRRLVRAADRGVPARRGSTCPSCGGTTFERERDILDVWFDSGSSHEAVLPRYAELTWPADMYLEGSDQHRGWFQSSLLVALATRGRPPFREVLTHGFLDRPRRPEDVEVARQHDRAAGGDQGERRRDPPAVGGDDRVHRGAARQQGDPDARRRGLPQAAEHVPHPRREPVRLRSGDRHGAGRPRSTRSIATRWPLRRGRAAHAARPTTRTTSPTVFADAEHARDRRPQRLLRGRDEGSAVHAGRAGRASGARRRRRCT